MKKQENFKSYFIIMGIFCLLTGLYAACQNNISDSQLTQNTSPMHASQLATESPIYTAIPTVMRQESTPTRTAKLTPTITLTPTPLPWRVIARGISQAYIKVASPESGEFIHVYGLKIDPTKAAFKIHYDQEQPHSITEWQQITNAPILFNGGFFGGNNAPEGRIVLDGEVIGSALDYGESRRGIPGLFAITNGKPEIFALGRDAYNPRGMRFDLAVECYPMLVLPGGQPTWSVETNHRARRTVIALDEQGYVMILIVDLPVFSLFEISHWLANSDLGIDSALNLDGGRSSALMVYLPNEGKTISSFVPLPIVIGVYPEGD